MKKIILLLFLISGSIALASSGHGEGLGVDGEDFVFPVGTVLSQIVNLGLLVAILYFWQGKAIAQAFKDKRDNFLKAVDEASSSKSQAENKLKEVEDRVKKLRSNYQQDVVEAKKNAEESFRNQVATAKNEAVRIKDSALGSLESEVQKEIENLRVETFKKSAGMAEEKLEKNLSPDQQKAWNNHFANAAKGVH